MKKLLILTTALLIIGLSAFAYPKTNVRLDKEDSLSTYVYNNSSKVSWTSYKNVNIANFVKDGYKMKAYFDDQGNLVSTTKTLKNRNELPAIVLEKLEKEYSNWGINNLYEETGLEKEIVYYARISDGKDSQMLKIKPNGRIVSLN